MGERFWPALWRGGDWHRETETETEPWKGEKGERVYVFVLPK